MFVELARFPKSRREPSPLVGEGRVGGPRARLKWAATNEPWTAPYPAISSTAAISRSTSCGRDRRWSPSLISVSTTSSPASFETSSVA